MDTPPANPFAALGLPAHYAPTPLSWTFGALDAQGPRGKERVHLLIVDTIVGRVAFAFDRESFRRLADQIVEQVSGIQVATALPVRSAPRHLS